jgi:hypothetical protein
VEVLVQVASARIFALPAKHSAAPKAVETSKPTPTIAGSVESNAPTSTETQGKASVQVVFASQIFNFSYSITMSCGLVANM